MSDVVYFVIFYSQVSPSTGLTTARSGAARSVVPPSRNGGRSALLGWKAYLGLSEVLSPLKELDKWIRRKLRCYQWKQLGRAGYRRLRALGVSRELAWNTAKSAHGPWRLSRSPALAYAMNHAYFTRLGLPYLARS